MSYSLNEVEALSRRAARGAGLDWGLVEETAKATRWLCGHDFDGCGSLVLVLEAHLDSAQDLQAPGSLTGEWQGQSGLLCPLHTGASLSDCADQIAADGVTLHNLYSPLMLLPFVASVARRTNTSLTASWNGVSITTDGQAVDQEFAHGSSAYSQKATRLDITVSNTPCETAVAHTRAFPTSQVLERLNTLGARTYAPATETSRRLGAGAGQTDND